uniref:Uncharacterized protein n=1 Tax=Taeniopygia guttata TaxID=59729 RepID=A0A674HMU4_TAEGU
MDYRALVMSQVVPGQFDDADCSDSCQLCTCEEVNAEEGDGDDNSDAEEDDEDWDWMMRWEDSRSATMLLVDAIHSMLKVILWALRVPKGNGASPGGFVCC